MTTAGTLGRAISFALFGLALTSCTVTTRTQPVDAYAYSEPVPDDVYVTYPTHEYEGRRYVWYRDRWIYRDGDRWSYVHESREPYELRRHRPYVQEAPPAYGGGYGGGGYGGGPPPPLPAPR